MKNKILLFLLLFLFGIITKTFGDCGNEFFYAINCGYEVVYTSLNPLTAGCEHWPDDPTNQDPHIAKYQNQLTINAPSGLSHTCQFLSNEAQNLMDNCRAQWSGQCNTPRRLVWQTSTVGGNFYWTKDPTVIPGNGPAMGCSALDNENRSHIVDASNCSPSNPIRLRSEIVFNNSEKMYRDNPQWRWTTASLNPCTGKLICLDFESIALHELGHYVGLAHDANQLCIMYKDYYGRKVLLQPCDADKFRRLYCTASVDVKDEINSENIEMEVYPNPSSDFFTVKLNLKESNQISLYITDYLGNEIMAVADEIFTSGSHEVSFPIYDIPSGNYFVRLEFDKKFITKKFIIAK